MKGNRVIWFVHYMIYPVASYGFIAYDLGVLPSFLEVGVKRKKIYVHTKKILF